MLKPCKRHHMSSTLPEGRLNGRCRECRNEMAAARYQRSKWLALRSDRWLELRDRSAGKPRDKARDRANAIAWRKAHPERVKEAGRRYYAKNRERVIASAKEWRKAHPERARELDRRGLKRRSGYYTAKAKERRARRGAQRCSCCRPCEIARFYADAHALGLEVDHQVAIALGGKHCLKNLKALAPAEHAWKTKEWDMPLIEHVRKKT